MAQACIPSGSSQSRYRSAHEHTAEFHIYPEVSGTLLSWGAAKALHILPPHFPNPPQPPTLCLTAAETTSQDIRTDFPTVFDGLIKTMEGEKFHIALTGDSHHYVMYV